MAANRTRAEGRQLQVTLSSGGVNSGDPGACGQLTGVAQYPKDASNRTVLDSKGVYRLLVKSIDAAINAGDLVYYQTSGDVSDDFDGAGAVKFGIALGVPDGVSGSYPSGQVVANGNTTTKIDVKLIGN